MQKFQIITKLVKAQLNMKRLFLFSLVFFFFFFIRGKANPNFFSNNVGFVENKGQIRNQDGDINHSIKFICSSRNMNLLLKRNSFSYEIFTNVNNSVSYNEIACFRNNRKGLNDNKKFTINRIDIELIDANQSPKIITDGKSTNYANYYTYGTSEKGITNVHYYKRIIYENIYPHIDLEFVYVNSNENLNTNVFKYNFILKKDANINDIKLFYKGVENIEIDKNNIKIKTAAGFIVEKIPISFLFENNEKIDIEYKQIRINTCGFVVKDSIKTLHNSMIIDPWVTYFGGNSEENSSDVRADNNDNIYMVGDTYSTNNIATTGSYQVVINGTTDAFLVKYSSNGTRLWSTYYGGSNAESGFGLTIDKSGNSIIIGTTQSPTNIATSVSHQTNLIGVNNAFIAKFDTNGIRQWATYYGGGSENGWALANDSSDNIYIIGSTGSSTNIATSNAFQPTLQNSSIDAFIVKFNSAGIRQWGTYYGGDGLDEGTAIAVDVSEDIVFTGYAYSANNIATNGSYQPLLNGNVCGFIVKFNSTGNRIWGSYYGGNNGNGSYYIATDNNKNIIIMGETSSNNSIATLGAYQTTLNGNSDYFIAKFTSTGNRLWGTYFGGEGYEQCSGYGPGISIDSFGNIYFVGETESHNNISTTGSYKTSLSGTTDAFLAKLNSNGNIVWSTYFGGIGLEGGTGTTFTNQCKILICGYTSSTTGISTFDASQILFGGGAIDAFLASFDSTGHITSIPFLQNEPISSRITLSPNPTKELLTVTIENKGVLKGDLIIIDAFGKTIQSIGVKEKETIIDVKSFSSGVYLLRYEADGIMETAKFVKE